MAAEIGSGEVIGSLLLVKAILAMLGVLLFIYYKVHWDRAKRHLEIHHFFTKWKTVRHAMVLGLATIGFAVGFSVELFGEGFGLTPNWARFVSSVFEIGSQFCLLFFFFSLALEDVPHFQHAEESVHHRHHAHQHEQLAVLAQKPVQQPAKRRQTKKKALGKKKR